MFERSKYQTHAGASTVDLGRVGQREEDRPDKHEEEAPLLVAAHLQDLRVAAARLRDERAHARTVLALEQAHAVLARHHEELSACYLRRRQAQRVKRALQSRKRKREARL